MRFSDLIFKQTNYPKGIQSIVKFGEYSLSIVRNEMSYGNRSNLYEIGVLKGNDQVVLAGITDDHDSVKGWLTEEEVSGILLKMHTLTSKQGVQ